MRDRNGNISLQIENNEWKTPADFWDCIVKGQTITLNSKPRHIELLLRVDPPHRIIIERLYMQYKGGVITCERNGKLRIEIEGLKLETIDAYAKDCRVGIDITKDGIGFALGGMANSGNLFLGGNK